jgi:uncharacterized membrane protein YkvA (DUF1232 family)
MWFWAQATSWQDIAALTRRMVGNEQELRRDFWRKLKGAVADLPFAEDLLAAYYCAFDRQTPLHVKAVLLGAIAYFILPTDLIPDYIPVIGFIDDAAVPAPSRSSARTLSRSIAKRRGVHWHGCAAKPDYGRSRIFPITLRSLIALSAVAISDKG